MISDALAIVGDPVSWFDLYNINLLPFGRLAVLLSPVVIDRCVIRPHHELFIPINTNSPLLFARSL